MVIINFKRVSILVCILGLLGSYVVGLPEQAIASPHLQVIQIARAKQEIKTLLPSFLKQLPEDIKTVPLPDPQKTKLDKDIELIDASIANNDSTLQKEWNEIKEILEALKSISKRQDDEGIRTLQKSLISRQLLNVGSDDGGWGSGTEKALTRYFSSKKIKVDSLLKNSVAVASPIISTPKPNALTTPIYNEQTKPSGGEMFLIGIFGIILLIGLAALLAVIYILREEIKKLRDNLSNTAQTIKVQSLQDIRHKDAEIKKIREEQRKQSDQTTSLEAQVRENIDRIIYLETKIGKTIEPKTYNENIMFPNSQRVQPQNKPSEESYQNSKITPEQSLEDKIAINYNYDTNRLVEYSTRVSETEESIAKRRNDSSYSIALGEIDNGNYWILTLPNESKQWLVPMGGLEIDKYILKTVEALFIYLGKPSSSFKLVKPAVVISTNKGEWQLEEKGEIEFTE